ncbi:hypothetical protein ID875_32730 [Streptomyces globisporus]|uniref:Uncharacterized protein n=1 Tax=Streptomyces globisporus TaxID=1908 RepID=A0A927GPP7_STRGL|nr:hypothetical protein [Streptomyces globisporus]
MSRKPAIREAEPSVVVSHGCDFFGEDRHPLKDIAALSPYLEEHRSVPGPPRGRAAGGAAGRAGVPDAAGGRGRRLAEHLLKVARNRRIKPGVAALARSWRTPPDGRRPRGELDLDGRAVPRP